MLNFMNLIDLFLPYMKRIVFFIAFFSVLGSAAFGQRKIQQLDEDEAKKQEELKKYEKGKKGFDPEKLSVGGNLGGAFGNGGGFIMLQPLVGYYVTEKAMLGLGGTYIYNYQKFNGKTYSSNTYGPILFARYNVLPSLFAHAEYQPLNFDWYNPLTFEQERIWINQAYVGGGYGGRQGTFIYVLYDVLYDQNRSFYASPWVIRLGFML